MPKSALRGPRVSILMAVYNAEKYIKKALMSISAQTFMDFELVVLDDGSTDRSIDILRAYNKIEHRMRLISRQNLGLIATRNELLHTARGELIAWMDADDISATDRIYRQVVALDRNKSLVCVGSDVQQIDPNDAPLHIEHYLAAHGDIVQRQNQGGGMRFPATMQRLQAAVSIGGFREPFRIGEDLDFLLRIGEIGDLSNINEILYYYRQHPGSTCATYRKEWPLYRDEIIRLANERRERGSDRIQTGEGVELPSPSRTDFASNTCEVYMAWAFDAVNLGDYLRAAKYILQSIFADPVSSQTWRSLARFVAHRGIQGKLKRISTEAR